MRFGRLSRQLASLAGPIFVETLLVMMLGTRRYVGNLRLGREHPRPHLRPPLEQLQMGWQKLREIKKPAKISFSRSSFSVRKPMLRVSRA